MDMTPEVFEAEMKRIEVNRDAEGRHREADDLMCELLESMGYGSGIEIFRNMDKWYA